MNNLFLPNQYVYNLRKLDNGCVVILDEHGEYMDNDFSAEDETHFFLLHDIIEHENQLARADMIGEIRASIASLYSTKRKDHIYSSAIQLCGQIYHYKKDKTDLFCGLDDSFLGSNRNCKPIRSLFECILEENLINGINLINLKKYFNIVYWNAANRISNYDKMKESILNKIKESEGDFLIDIRQLKKEW